MRALKLALLAAAVFAFASAASAQTRSCVVVGTVTQDAGVTDVTGIGGSFTCDAVPSSTPDADDHFEVPAGATLNITATWTQTTGTANGIDVQSGGALNVTVSTAAFVLTVGPAGIECDDGATCNFTGAWRTPANTITTDYEVAKASHWAVSQVMPCPKAVDNAGTTDDYYEPDCADATAKTQGGLLFQAARSTAPTGSDDPTLLAAINGIDVANDLEIVHFFAPTSATYRAADEMSMYQITGLVTSGLGFGSTDDRMLVLDILQGEARDPVASDGDGDCADNVVDIFPGEGVDGYTYAKRALAESTLTAAISRGENFFRVGTGLGSEAQIIDCLLGALNDVAVEEVGTEYVGRWVRFLEPYSPDTVCNGGATLGSRCIADSRRVYRVMDREEDPYASGTLTDDRFWIANADGFGEARASGAQLFLDHGWVTGDPFVVMLPVWVRSSTSTAGSGTKTEVKDSELNFDGRVATDGVVFDELGSTRTGFGARPASGVDIDLKRTWFRDVSGDRDYWEPKGFQRPGFEVIRLEDVQYTPGDMYTGGGADPTEIRTQHFLVPDITGTGGETQGNITLRNLMLRYAEDDSVGMVQGASCAINIDAKYIRSQYASMGGGSLGTFDMQTIATPETCRLTIEDAECVRCGDDEFASAAKSINGLLQLGTPKGAWISQGTAMTATVTGYTAIGGSYDENGADWGPCVNDATSFCNVSDFVVRDVKIINDDGNHVSTGRSMVFYANLTNGLLNRVSWGGSYIANTGQGILNGTLQDGEIHNLAFVDNDVFDIANSWCDSNADCRAFVANITQTNSAFSADNLSFLWTSNFTPRTWVRRPGRFATIGRTSKGACGNVSDCYFASMVNVGMAQNSLGCSGCSLAMSDVAYFGARAPICGTGSVGAEDCGLQSCRGCRDPNWEAITTTGTTGLSFGGEWCVIGNVAYNDATLAETTHNITTTEAGDLGTLGVTEIYTTTQPALMSNSDGNARIGVSDKMDECGVRGTPPGVRRRYRYHMWNKIEPENLGNLRASGQYIDPLFGGGGACSSNLAPCLGPWQRP